MSRDRYPRIEFSENKFIITLCTVSGYTSLEVHCRASPSEVTAYSSISVGFVIPRLFQNNDPTKLGKSTRFKILLLTQHNSHSCITFDKFTIVVLLISNSKPQFHTKLCFTKFDPKTLFITRAKWIRRECLCNYGRRLHFKHVFASNLLRQ